MPKGKKFDAAEKHFLEKEVKYRKQIKTLEDQLAAMRTERVALVTDMNTLHEDNKALRKWIDKLLAYTELPLEDIKTVCEQDKRRGEALTALLGMARAVGV